jgi:hypothetical protein
VSSVSSAFAGAIVIGAAAVAVLHPWEASNAIERAPSSTEVPAATTVSGALPPNHPPLDTTASPHEGMQAPVANPDEAPAITWQPPASWKTMPNPNPMRIATYRPAADSELIVVRAGGTTDANIQRWIGQFDEPAQTKRSRRTVHGLGVEILEASGTYQGGGMTAAAQAQPHPGWSLLGAVVETPGSSYFFKLVGPSAQVQAARESFDALIGSIRPL